MASPLRALLAPAHIDEMGGEEGCSTTKYVSNIWQDTGHLLYSTVRPTSEYMENLEYIYCNYRYRRK